MAWVCFPRLLRKKDEVKDVKRRTRKLVTSYKFDKILRAFVSEMKHAAFSSLLSKGFE
jgi:hypothetical protein